MHTKSLRVYEMIYDHVHYRVIMSLYNLQQCTRRLISSTRLCISTKRLSIRRQLNDVCNVQNARLMIEIADIVLMKGRYQSVIHCYIIEARVVQISIIGSRHMFVAGVSFSFRRLF